MSVANVYHEMNNGDAGRVSTDPVAIANINDATYGTVMVFGVVAGAPGTYAQETGTYAGGCIMIDITNKIAYSNQSAVSATPSWTVLS